jgi:hypothetical protein
MTNSLTKVMWQEITDDRAECLNGGGWKDQDIYLGSVGALQVNGGNGVQNNYYIFNFYFNVGGSGGKKHH